MFFKFLIRALLYRKQRLILAFSALAVAATLATVLFDIYGSVERRVRDEFRSYGANLVAVPVNGSTIPTALVAAAEKLGAQASPVLVTAARLGGESVPVAGLDSSRSAGMTSYWHTEGNRNIGAAECLAGESIAARFRLQIGSPVNLQGAPCTLKGIVSTGGTEDTELIVPFASASAIAGTRDAASAIEIRAPSERLEVVRAALAKQFPGADIRIARAIAGAESNVVFKLRASLFLLTFLVLAITTLCVSSNFSELVIERSKEVGILKALGGAERRIAAFFLSESAALALTATLVGYAVGVFVAAIIGEQIFGGSLRFTVDWIALLSVAGVMLTVAFIATAVSASRIWKIEPAVILRGE